MAVHDLCSTEAALPALGGDVGGNAIIRRRLRGEQTGSRATTLAGSNGARGHVCPQ